MLRKLWLSANIGAARSATLCHAIRRFDKFDVMRCRIFRAINRPFAILGGGAYSKGTVIANNLC